MFDLFKKLKSGLEKTRQNLTEGVRQVLAGFRPIDESLFEDLEEVLIGADVGLATTEKLLDRLRRRVASAGVRDSSGVEALLREEIKALLIASTIPAGAGASSIKPRVVVVVGVNGVGKTTTIGKLAYRHAGRKQKVVIAASDTFRAAASEQLGIWAERAGVDIVRSNLGADPAAVAYDGLVAAMAREADLLIIDTAGRLQTKKNLMQELEKIGRVLHGLMPGAPHEVLLVLDASTGQNAIVQAREFGKTLGVTGLVLTKLDGTARGGVVLAIADQLGLPVRWVGLGEKIGDLDEFDATQFAAALFEIDSAG
ncbi:MAG: signal recognition particle-docking protein FtsY [Candidatus Eisenbacteria bacterium]|nr:signal recognition particle-docking protein FtsY [Candidatus Eisenbacteria bacterium]